MRRAPSLRLLSLTWILALCACSIDPSDTEPQSPPKIPATVQPSQTKATTAGSTALKNLDSRIASLEGLVERHPRDLDFQTEYLGLLISRTVYTGSYGSDFSRARELARATFERLPKSKQAVLNWCKVLGTLHEFEEALALLEANGLTELTSTYGDHLISLGRDPRPVEAARRKRAARYPTYDALSSWAVALAAIGDFEGADAAYQAALDAYRDVSPLPIAWVEFQRGVLWAERAGDADRGYAAYERARAILPDYVVLSVHWAEATASRGREASAIEALRSVAEVTEDAEPLGLLARLLSPGKEADDFRGEALARYDSFLSDYPKAFLDHGSEFFSGDAGRDAERGLTLALENYSHRKDDRALLVALRAALGNQNDEVACSLAREAQLEVFPGFFRPSVVLAKLAYEVLESAACASSGPSNP